MTKIIHTLFTFAFFLLFKFHSCSFDCNSIDKCLCLPFKEIELQCPTEEGDLVIHYTENEDILIDCPPDAKKFNINDLPNITIDTIYNFQIRFCPFRQKPFKEIFKWFSLKHVPSLRFSFSDMNNITLKHYYFKELGGLKDLDLSENKIINVDSNAFRNIPNLTTLRLQDNEIILKPNLFSTIPKLIFLDLSGNGLSHLPPNIFQPLKKLQILDLRNNALQELDEFTFNGLNLQSLDLKVNKIEHIAENTFQEMKNLTYINLSSNDIKYLPPKLFNNNKKLKEVRITNNFHLIVSDHLFANLSLMLVDLTNCYLRTIPDRIFENTTTLKIIKLGINRIKHLPEVLFRQLINLEQIRLHSNEIETISNTAFRGLKRLKLLHLQNNSISVLDKDIFIDLTMLEEINLAENKISHIDINLFSNNMNLIKINLSHNNIIDLELTVGLQHALYLSLLDLSHNHITRIELKNMNKLSNAYIKLDYNNVTVVDFGDIDSSANFTMSLGNNPLECDCRSYDLVEYFKRRRKKKSSFNISPKNLYCADLTQFKNLSLDLFSLPSTLTCPLETISKKYENCPQNCSCNWRPWDKSLIIDCSNQNLTTFPQIDLSHIDFVPYNQTEIHLENNDLTVWPTNKSPGYNNVTKLFLSNNQLWEITWLPFNLEVLQLDYNQLENLNQDVIEKMNVTKLIELTLNNNPWVCDCSSNSLANLLRNSKNLVNKPDVSCVNVDSQLIDLKRSDLCYDLKISYIIFLILSVLLTVSIFCALYYRYQERIKIWLFANHFCMWFVNEETLDRDKLYDAFISYSHKDEDFIVKKLLPVLESGPQPYKLCLHYRNWIPGELITTQITNSVLKSRRTLVVLSKNFLDSVWGKMEFRTAHTQAMSDGRARVIMVLYGDLDISMLDEELKMYLKTNTYVKWGDPYFWNKLKYALPTQKRTISKSRERQRLSSVVNLVDDKSQLIQSVPNSPVSNSSSWTDLYDSNDCNTLSI